MVQPSEVFDARMERFGGRVERSIALAEESLFEYHHHRSDAWIRSIAQATSPARRFHFDYVMSPGFNAHAFSVEGWNFVALHLGVVPIIHDLFLRIMAHPDLFTSVGDPTQEREPEQDRRPDLRDAETMITSGSKDGGPLLPVAPRNLTRKLYARLLATTAIEFLVAHEVGHLVNGHVGLLNQLGGNDLAEFGWEAPVGLTNLDQQTMEMDADCFAASQGIFRTLDRFRRPETLNEEWRKAFTTFEDAVRTWVSSVFLLFRLFGPGAGLASRATARHPPPRVRQLYVVVTAGEFLKSFAETEMADCFTATNALVVKDCEIAFGRIGGEPPRYDGLPEATSPPALAYLDELLVNWKQLRPRLLPLACWKLVE